MADQLDLSQQERQQIDKLLEHGVPGHREAFSDRTAWRMAWLSELAYLRFNPLFSNDEHKDFFVDNLSKLVDENRKSALLKLIDALAYDPAVEESILKNELGGLDLQFQQAFDRKGTQAVLASSDDFIMLAFRGTEATSVKDIKADAKATLSPCETGGRIHEGFKGAYDAVADEIQTALNLEAHAAKPLLVTGHSLGGALATVAAKKLRHRAGIAACYTFGSPRVGDEAWVAGIKTPVYRLVNAADCVTMLPPGAEIMTLLSWLAKFIPGSGETISGFLSRFDGYLHGGNMRYLTNCTSADYSTVRLLYAVSFFYRLKGFLINKLPWKHFLKDHSISVYRQKLAIVAEQRNPQPP